MCYISKCAVHMLHLASAADLNGVLQYPIHFDQDETSTTITIDITDDTLKEVTENFFCTIPTGSLPVKPSISVGVDATTCIRIEDDDSKCRHIHTSIANRHDCFMIIQV